MAEFNKTELKEKFTNIKKAFKSFNKFELKSRKHIQKAILDCFDVYLHYNEKLIKKRCKKAGIKYKVKKPMKMILMLAMGVSDKCNDERVKAKIRTYVRVLKRFDSLNYDFHTAEECLSKYGIDYYANPRSKNKDDSDDMDENDDDDKQPELPFGDDDENTEEDDEDEDEADDDIDEDDNNNADTKTSTSESQKKSLGDKTVKFFQLNKIKDKNYVIWVNGNNVYKSTDAILLQKLNVSNFMKL